MALTKKRRIFIEEYLKCWNATEAARRAGYKHPNVQGPTLVNLSIIREAIKQRLDEVAMEADEVLARLSEQARADIADFITVNETGLPLLDLRKAEGKTHLIKSVRETKEGTFIELYNSQSALVHMGKAHGAFEERHVIGLDESTKQFLTPFFALVARYIPADKMDEYKAELEKIAAGEDA